MRMRIYINADAKNYLYLLAASTHDQDVFSFYPNERFCNGFEEVLSRHREIVPHLRLAGFHYLLFFILVLSYLLKFIQSNNYYNFLPGPTSFAPIIEMAMTIVEQSGGQYHVLVIIADGQVFSSLFVGLLSF